MEHLHIQFMFNRIQGIDTKQTHLVPSELERYGRTGPQVKILDGQLIKFFFLYLIHPDSLVLAYALLIMYYSLSV